MGSSKFVLVTRSPEEHNRLDIVNLKQIHELEFRRQAQITRNSD